MSRARSILSGPHGRHGADLSCRSQPRSLARASRYPLGGFQSDHNSELEAHTFFGSSPPHPEGMWMVGFPSKPVCGWVPFKQARPSNLSLQSQTLQPKKDRPICFAERELPAFPAPKGQAPARARRPEGREPIAPIQLQFGPGALRSEETSRSFRWSEQGSTF